MFIIYRLYSISRLRLYVYLVFFIFVPKPVFEFTAPTAALLVPSNGLDCPISKPTFPAWRELVDYLLLGHVQLRRGKCL